MDQLEAHLSVEQILIGLVLAVVIAYGGYRARSLSRSGVLAAVFVGALTFGFGGWLAAAVLITFFVSSSVLSKVGGKRKMNVATEFAKGGQRDHGQVLANGSIAAICAVLFGITGQTTWLAGLAGALAAVNADTWSTELGVLSKKQPRLITSGLPVQPGTSGGVTLVGTLAAVVGATAIGLITIIAPGSLVLGITVIIAGTLGSIVDSLLGASVQAIYYCPLCEKQTERFPIHSCGTTTSHLRGWIWLSNDLVNFIASVTGAVLAILLWSVI